jgi:hypothetical protein
MKDSLMPNCEGPIPGLGEASLVVESTEHQGWMGKVFLGSVIEPLMSRSVLMERNRGQLLGLEAVDMGVLGPWVENIHFRGLTGE